MKELIHTIALSALLMGSVYLGHYVSVNGHQEMQCFMPVGVE